MASASTTHVVTGKAMSDELSRTKQQLADAKQKLRHYVKVTKAHRNDLPWCTHCDHPLEEEPVECTACQKRLPCVLWCGGEGPHICGGEAHVTARYSKDPKARYLCDECYVDCTSCSETLCRECAFWCETCDASACVECIEVCPRCKKDYCADCSEEHKAECGKKKKAKGDVVEDVAEADAFWRM